MLKLFGMKNKKPETANSLSKGFTPTDKVKNLSDKGFSEPEIIDMLRKEGFGAEEIDSALTQSLKIGVTGESSSAGKLPTLKELQTQESVPSFVSNDTQMPQIPEQSFQYNQQQEYGTEELVEAIVRERMGELDQKLSEFKIKYSSLERRIVDLHNQLTVLTKGRREGEEVIINKIDSFKEIITDIDGRLSSLEKAFKEALPALIESVRALTDLVQRFKKEG